MGDSAWGRSVLIREDAPHWKPWKERLTPIGFSTAQLSHWWLVCHGLGLLDGGLMANKGHSCHFVYDWC